MNDNHPPVQLRPHPKARIVDIYRTLQGTPWKLDCRFPARIVKKETQV